MTPTRRRFLRGSLALAGLGLASGCGLLPSAARPSEVPAVGLLSGFSQNQAHEITDPFRQGLAELGYVEGRNIALELRLAEGRYERLPELAAELVARPVRVIFAPDGSSALAARAATASIPIVFATSDPVANGLVESYARPGGNVTGLSFASVLLAGKRLELLKQVAPATRRVVALWYVPTTADQLREFQEAAPRLGIDLRPVGIQSLDDLDAAFHAASAEQPDALCVIDGGLNTRRARILEFVAGTGLPSMFVRRESVAGGGLMAYGPSFPDIYHRGASYVDKILKGARPGDLPIEQPTTFDLVINLKTARELGLTIPESVLQQATEVIH